MKTAGWWMVVPSLVAFSTVQAETVTCESIKQQRHECEMDTRGEVRMVEQLSKTPCTEGVTWGLTKHAVWIDGGCRGVFVSAGASGAAATPSAPAPEQIAACNAVQDRYGDMVSSTALTRGAFEVILRYDDGDYACNVDADNKVSYFEKLRGQAADAKSGGGENSTATRAGQGDFDASGMIPCALARGQPMGQCPFKVARGAGGDATVVITRPDGRTRAIFFEDSVAVSADSSQADGYGEFKASKEADLYLIRVGDERYEIPEAAIFGG